MQMAQFDPNIRLRGTVYWFRRRVPESLVPLIGRKELLRSLGTSCRAQAKGRSRVAWLATERVFQLAREQKSLSREQVDVILRRLMTESVWDSATQASLLDEVRLGEMRFMDLLFSADGHEAILSLPAEARETAIHHLTRLLDGVEIATHQSLAERAKAAEQLADVRREVAVRESPTAIPASPTFPCWG
jgi:hypothetical protein